METRDPIKDIIGTCAAQAAAISAMILSPLVVGALIVGLHIGEMEAGSLITVEMLVVGITSMMCAPLMIRVPHHLLAIASTIVLIAGHGLSAQAADISELYLWRTVAGLGAGCLLATVNAAIAQARSPVRLYGFTWAAGYVFTALMAIGVTESNDVVTHDIVYTWLGVALLIFLPLLGFVPRHGGEAVPAPFPRSSISAGCLLSLAIVLIGLSMMAYYAFIERLAVQIGASPVQTGRIIAGAQVAGIVGGLSAAPVASRFGLIRTLVVVTILHAVAITFAIWTSQILVLGIIVFIEAVLFIMLTPMMMTLAANIDNKGRWAAIAAGALTLSTALGPVTGAALIESVGYQAIAWLQYFAALPAVYIFIRVYRHSSKPDTV